MPENNIQTTGPLTGNKLRVLNDDVQLGRTPEILSPFNPVNPGRDASRDVFSPLYDNAGDYWGKSRFDRRNPFLEDEQFDRVADLRAQEQSWTNKLLNGTIKMLTTAGTTFLDNTVGFLWGVTAGIKNTIDDNPETNFWRGLWDNEFNKAMVSVQDAMEKVAPNYYTEKELNNPWYKNIWTANFWGDKFLKNMGFTMGSLASMAVGLGDIGAVAKSGVTGLAKSITFAKALKGSKFARNIYKSADTAGAIAQKLVNTAVMSHGEAAIEAINGVKGNKDNFIQNLENWKNNQIQQVNQWYSAHRGEVGAYEKYLSMLGEIDAGFEQANKENDDTVRALGNSIYGMNMLLLSITNNLEFGKYIKGGYNQSKSIANLNMFVDNVATTDQKLAGRALAQGRAVRFAADESLNKIGKDQIGNIIGGTLARNLEEGFEEGAQNLISDSGQMQAQAKINVNLRKWSKEHGNSLFAQSLNPDVTDDLVDRSKAFMNAWRENFGSIDAPGWEEVFLGALTGGIGTLGFKIDKKTGSVRPSWQGGFWEEIQKPKERYGEQEVFAEMINKSLLSDEFRKRSAHAITAMALSDGMEADLITGDILQYKNKELMQVANDALRAKDSGGLEMYRSFYEELAKSVTDQDINEVKAAFRDPVTGKSYFDGLSNDDIKQNMRDKAKSTLEKIDSVLDSYDWHLRNYGEKFNTLSPIPGMSEFMLNEVVTLDALQKDLTRRRKELSDKAAVLDETNPEQNAEKTSLNRQIEQIDDSIADVKETYNKYIKNPESIVEDFAKISAEAYAHQLKKDVNSIKGGFKQAKTIQDIANIYYNSNTEKRNKILDEVRKEATPEMQGIIDTFKDYLATTQALPKVVENRMAGLEEEGINPNNAYRNTISQLLDNVVTRIVNDPDVTYQNPKSLVSDAIHKEAARLREGTDGYTKTESTEKYNRFFADELDSIANGLERYDIVYQAAKAGQVKQEPQPQPQAQPQVQPENTETTPEKPEQGQPVQSQPVQQEKTVKKVTIDTYTTRKGETKDISFNIHKYENGYTIVRPSIGSRVPWGMSRQELNDSGVSDDDLGKNEYNPEDSESFDSAFDRDNKFRIENITVGPDGSLELSLFNGKHLLLYDGNTWRKVGNPRKVLRAIAPKLADELGIKEDVLPADTKPAAKEIKKEEPFGTAESSLNGNSYLRYSVDENHTAKVRKDPASDWYHSMWSDLAMGYTIDDIQNNYVWKLLKLDAFKGKDGKGRIPVRYVKFNNHLTKSNGEDAGLNRYVFLGTEYTDDVKSVFPEEMKSRFRILEYGGKQYLVIGSLKAYTENNKSEDAELTSLEKMWEAVNDAATKQLLDRGENYTVLDEGENGEYTNYIYQVNNGEVITRYSGKERQDHSIKELLDNPETNPRGLSLGDLVFAVVMGDENKGGLYTSIIGKNNEKYALRDFVPSYAGQVYVYLPDSTGAWIPWGINPLAFTDIMSLPEDNQVRKDIQELVHNLAVSLSNANPEGEKLKEIKALLGELRSTLLFGSPDVQGSNFVYEEPREVDGEDGMTFPVGHSLKAFIGGEELMDFNLNRNPNVDTIEKDLYTMLESLNPHMNIDATVLRTTPEYYFDNGILTVDAQVFGTVNAQSFLYPLNDDMTPDMKFQVTKTNPDTSRGGSLRRVWLNGKQYRRESGVYTESNGKPIKDPNTLQMLEDVIDLTPDTATFTYRKAPYWIIGNRAYMSKKDGNFTTVDRGFTESKYQEFLKKEEDKKRKDNVKKKVEEQEKAPEMPEEKEDKKPVEQPVQKAEIPQGNKEKTTIFVDGFMKYADTLVSGENAQYLGTFANVNEYFEVLDKDRVDAMISDLLTLLVAEKTGENPLELDINQVMDAIWNSEYQQRLANAVEFPTEGQESIKDVIDNIIKCSRKSGL